MSETTTTGRAPWAPAATQGRSRGWTLDPDLARATFRDTKGTVYTSHLLRDASSPAQLVDTIAQLANKPFIRNEDLGQYVRLVCAAVDPQLNLCTGGIDVTRVRPFDVRAWLARQASGA